ncbi:MAG: hypothetical protein ACK5OI_06240 [Curvibacter sp.]|jgi:hypothetical protein
MKPTHKKRASDATRAEINESRRALVRSYQTASDFTDEDGRRVTRISVDLNVLKAVSRLGGSRDGWNAHSSNGTHSCMRARKASVTDNTFPTETMLAARWHCSRSRLQHWRLDVKGPRFVKIGGRVLYALEDVRAFEDAQRSGV